MDEDDFTAFFRRMFPRLVAYARQGRDPQTAQDLAARALESLWRKDVPTPADADEWVQLESLTFAILRGLVRNETRAERRRRALFTRVSTYRPPSDEAMPTPNQDIPAWFLALPAADREVLTLLAEGYSVGEIAGIVGSTPAATAKRLSRARQRIRQMARLGKGDLHG